MFDINPELEERSCENCANVHCYIFTPKYELCNNGSLWQPYKNRRTRKRDFRNILKTLFKCGKKND